MNAFNRLRSNVRTAAGPGWGSLLLSRMPGRPGRSGGSPDGDKPSPSPLFGGSSRRNLWLLLAACVVYLVVSSIFFRTPTVELTPDEFLGHLRDGHVTEVALSQGALRLTGEFRTDDGTAAFIVRYPESMEGELIRRIRRSDLNLEVLPPPGSGPLAAIINLIPWVFFGFILYYVVRTTQGPGGRGFLGSRPQPAEVPDFPFSKLGGMDAAAQEIREVVNFLSNPDEYKSIGAKPPKGILLVGPPGTGKTALARATASEAKVPFFSLSGSEFVEMFVGVGARRVRDLFERAEAYAPAVVFIDEIDALGRQRGAGLGGGNDEREQTLNQLLVAIDGFKQAETPVVVIAATNRPDVLDPALLRRFSRQIVVDLPDRPGREEILRIHASQVALGDNVDLGSLAARTVGFSGSDLERLVNEAALIAAREKSRTVETRHLEAAFDRVVLGVERKTAVSSERDRRITAYHEAGHALVAWLTPLADVPVKVSIVPRGRAGGVTHTEPAESAYLTKHRALARLRMTMGGRAAEEVLLGDDVTSGASHDFQAASELAHDMVTKYGWGSLGPVYLNGRDDSPFLGRDLAVGHRISEPLAAEVEADVRRLLADALADARAIVAQHRGKLDLLAEALLESETLAREDLERLLGPRPELDHQPWSLT